MDGGKQNMFTIPENITVQADAYDCNKQICYAWGVAGEKSFPCPAGISGYGDFRACRAIRDRHRDLLRTAKIPVACLEDIVHKPRDAYFVLAPTADFSKLDLWFDAGGCYIISGPPASGKTATLCDLLSVALETGSALYVSYLKLITDLELLQAAEKAAWLYWLETVDVLGIDGIGNYHSNSRQSVFFWRILESRIDNKKATIITTSMAKNETKLFFPPVFLEKMRRNSRKICLSQACEEVL